MPTSSNESAVNPQEVSVSRTINATPEKLFGILADPTLHPVIDGSGSVRGARGKPERLTLGSKFGMNMRLGLPYPITNTVVEFQENRLIAWRHVMGHRWRYRLTPTDDGQTVVTETFDWSTARSPKAIELMKYPTKHVSQMQRTLELLDAFVTNRADSL